VAVLLISRDPPFRLSKWAMPPVSEVGADSTALSGTAVETNTVEINRHAPTAAAWLRDPRRLAGLTMATTLLSS
jgi:hypothetical protein